MKSAMSELVVFDEEMREARQYWLDQLVKLPAESGICLDYNRPTSFEQAACTQEIVFAGRLFQRLSDLTGGGAFLVYTTLLAALKVCLYKYTRNDVVAVGSPSRKSGSAAPEPTNAVVIVDELLPSLSCKALLLQIRGTLLEAYRRQRYPFERLLSDLGLAEVENKCPLFDVALGLRDIHGDLPALKNDATLWFALQPDRILGSIVYNRSLFKQDTVRRFVGHLKTILEEILANADRSISGRDLLSDAQRHQTVIEWSDTANESFGGSRICHLFERQAEALPDAVAVVCEDRHITYRELNRRINALGHHLGRHGVGPDIPVGILLTRTEHMVVAMLGTLKTGGAYVPLDPEYPKHRLATMIQLARPVVMLTELGLSQLIPPSSGELLCLNAFSQTLQRTEGEVPQDAALADSLAYIVFTSGSTGTPKGVMVTRRGLCNLVESQIAAFALTPDSRVLQFASFSL